MRYQRSQVIPALWKALAGPFTVAAVPMKSIPKPFVRRVGNLLDKGVGVAPENRAGRKGVFQEYSVEDVLELGIGLSMLNVGLPQADVIGYLLNFREEIRNQAGIVPPETWGRFPNFLVVRPRALNEISRQHRALPERSGQVSFFKPEFVSDEKGWGLLAKGIGLQTGELILIEIGDLVVKIRGALAETRAGNRGRQ